MEFEYKSHPVYIRVSQSTPTLEYLLRALEKAIPRLVWDDVNKTKPTEFIPQSNGEDVLLRISQVGSSTRPRIRYTRISPRELAPPGTVDETEVLCFINRMGSSPHSYESKPSSSDVWWDNLDEEDSDILELVF